jgi:hypothetical protein
MLKPVEISKIRRSELRTLIQELEPDFIHNEIEFSAQEIQESTKFGFETISKSYQDLIR